MRKQTKFVAVLSAVALLAIGASMTSFAATAWTEENGTWVYYNSRGEKVTEEWKKSGDNWFWLNEDGEMATDTLIENDDNHYYVDVNGAMVVNRWISIENEDYDGEGDDEPANYWYYFGSNGRAYKTSTNANNASFKTINGKKYIFDEDGKMLYGWIDTSGERQTGDEAWIHGTYYCGDENDGAQKAGEWAYLDIVDTNYTAADPAVSSPNVFDDENQTRWFYFNTNGKKYVSTTKTINGAKYDFDQYGRMNAEWVIYNVDPSLTKASPMSTATLNQGNASYTSNFRYYGDPESGARKTKGWFQVVPDSYLSLDDYNDDADNWYYADKNGNLVASKLMTINGKKYAFNEYGVMQSGLKAIKFVQNSDGTYSTTDISEIKGDTGITTTKRDANGDLYTFDGTFDTEDSFRAHISALTRDGWKIYYFGSSSDGAMKTGKQTITIDGETFTFLFNNSGSSKGQGKFGVDDKKYYAGGMLMAADRTDRYAVVKLVTPSGSSNYSSIELLTTEEYLEDVVKYFVCNSTIPAGKDYVEYLSIGAKKTGVTDTIEYKLVNTAGTVQKSKTKAKDGDDRCFTVVNEKITTFYVED